MNTAFNSELESSQFVKLFQQAIELELNLKKEEIVKEAEEKFKLEINNVINKIIGQFVGTVNFKYSGAPNSYRPEITISFSIFEEKK